MQHGWSLIESVSVQEYSLKKSCNMDFISSIFPVAISNMYLEGITAPLLVYQVLSDYTCSSGELGD